MVDRDPQKHWAILKLGIRVRTKFFTCLAPEQRAEGTLCPKGGIELANRLM
jgi:hypothetical protein